LYSQLTEGELRYKQHGEDHYVAIHGGFLSVAHNVVTVLADAAARCEDLDISVIEEARRQAEEAMRQKLSAEDFALAEANLRRALLNLRVAQRKK